MNSNETRPQGRRQQRGGRRPYNDRRRERDSRSRGERPREQRPAPVKKISFWQKLLAFFTGGGKNKPQQSSSTRPEQRPREYQPRQDRQKPEPVEVTSAKLYVGNLSYEATESDLFELFKGVGQVQNAEVVTHRGSEKSKGFGFVTMLTIDEARRAVEKLHDQPFMGRKLVVNGSRSSGPRE